MGQTIEVSRAVLGEVALFDTDRSVTGQDGHRFTSVTEAGDGTTTAAALAARIFESDAAILHVFVLSNQVTVRRTGGWGESSLAAVTEAIRDFFVFYEENRGGTGEAPD